MKSQWNTFLAGCLSLLLVVATWYWTFDRHSTSNQTPGRKPAQPPKTLLVTGGNDGDQIPFHVHQVPPPSKYLAVFPNSEEYSENDSITSSEKTLNVHVVPHTHDDVGWLKTVEQYYFGWNNSIQFVCVDDILTTVVEALMENPSRTFTYVEQKFFGMWWDRQNQAMKETVRTLVQQGQLTFVNGGWCMHDEATTHFVGMIDQTTLGHAFLKKEFDVVPKVGWQLDPFGHSSTQASLMTYRMGFDALYFGRIDYQDLSKRQADRECEGLWNASNSWKDSSVFWGLTGSFTGNYGPPDGFCFDIHCWDYRPLLPMDQKTLFRAIEDFLLQVRQQSDRTKGDHVMLTMGSDFQYQRASINFANMDLLIGTIQHLQQWSNSDSIDIPAIFGPRYDQVNIFYSSPEYYTQCKHKETVRARIQRKWNATKSNSTRQGIPNSTSLRSLASNNVTTRSDKKVIHNDSDLVSWTVKQDDFFPYSDCPHCFWTGYFTSRPALKRLERVASSFLMAARQIEAMLDYTGTVDEIQCKDPMHRLEDASGVIQHHDGVSGTSKQHVAYDYAKRVQSGIDAVVPCAVRKVKRMLLGSKADEFLQDLTFCQLLNETKCTISVTSTKKNVNKDIYVVVYNSLAQKRSTVVRLPVAEGTYFDVEPYDIQFRNRTRLQTILAGSTSIPSKEDPTQQHAPFVLMFEANNLPPLGARVFRIRKSSNSPRVESNDVSLPYRRNRHWRKEIFPSIRDDLMSISNGIISVQIDTKTGNIQKIGSHQVENLTTWGYYTSFDWVQDSIRDDDHQNSGAYVFRPSIPDQKLQIISAMNATITNSSTGMEVHVTYEEPWIQTTTRILKGANYIEIEYQVGPIPTDDSRGKEVVVRYNTMVPNDATFFTDSNGREFIKRQRNHRPTWDLTVYEPVAGNYYPVNAAMYIEGKGGGNAPTAFAVVTDRSQGGTSLIDETVELMVHRRTLVDDFRGVDEPMNETDGGISPNAPWGNATREGNGLVIKGTHRILVSDSQFGETDVGGATLARSVMDGVFAEPLVFVGSSPSTNDVPFVTTSFSGLKEDLPKNVMLVTKKLLYQEAASIYLIRLAHQYGLGENSKLSLPAEVKLQSIFPGQRIQVVQETTLSGNLDISTWQQERLDWNAESIDKGLHNYVDLHADDGNLTITLQPMDIRTFKVTVA